MKSFLLLLLLFVTLIWAYEYRIANMPEEVKVAYYQAKMEEEKADEARKLKAEAQLSSFLSTPYSEVPDDKKLAWLAINSIPFLIVIGVVLAFIQFFSSVTRPR